MRRTILAASFTATSTAVVAQRHARRARAELDALLAETLPEATISAASTGSVALLDPATTIDAVVSGDPTPEFRFTGAQVEQAGPDFPLDWMATSTGLDSTFGGLTYNCEFLYTGAQLETRMRWTDNTRPPHRIWADGVLVGTTTVSGTADGSEVSWLTTFPSSQPRLIRLECAGAAIFAGIRIQTTATIAYPTVPKGPRCIVVGDSFVEGAGANSDAATLVARLALHMGWPDTWRSGSGGTGYLAVPEDIDPPRKTFRARAATDIIAHDPNIVIICGGYNDALLPPVSVTTEAGLLYTQLATALPDTEFIVVGPWGRTEDQWADYQVALRDGIRAQTQARGWYFVDPVAEGWITGTGRVGATAGDGNADLYISADNVHPSPAGHAYLAERLAGHLRTLGS